MTQEEQKRVEEIFEQNKSRVVQYFLQQDADNVYFLLAIVKRQFDELQSIKNWHTACEEQVTADSTQIKELLERLVKSEKRAEAAIAPIMTVGGHGHYDDDDEDYWCPICHTHLGTHRGYSDRCDNCGQAIMIDLDKSYTYREMKNGIVAWNDPTKEE